MGVAEARVGTCLLVAQGCKEAGFFSLARPDEKGVKETRAQTVGAGGRRRDALGHDECRSGAVDHHHLPTTGISGVTWARTPSRRVPG